MSAKGGLMMGTLSSPPKRIIGIIAYFEKRRLVVPFAANLFLCYKKFN